jgi:hypothetical protein
VVVQALEGLGLAVASVMAAAVVGGAVAEPEPGVALGEVGLVAVVVAGAGSVAALACSGTGTPPCRTGGI